MPALMPRHFWSVMGFCAAYQTLSELRLKQCEDTSWSTSVPGLSVYFVFNRAFLRCRPSGIRVLA